MRTSSTAASNEQAITLYRQALKADPSFALAKVWLAQAIGNRRYFDSQRHRSAGAGNPAAARRRGKDRAGTHRSLRGARRLSHRAAPARRCPAGPAPRARAESEFARGGEHARLLPSHRRRTARRAPVLHDGLGPRSPRFRHARVSVHGARGSCGIRRGRSRLRPRPRTRSGVSLGLQRRPVRWRRCAAGWRRL